MTVSTPGFNTFTSNNASCAYQPMVVSSSTSGPDNPQPAGANANGNWDCRHGVFTIDLTVTGGQGPYVWSASVGTITPGSPTTTAKLTPPANPGAALGQAYVAVSKFCFSLCFTDCVTEVYNCDDSVACPCNCAAAGGNPYLVCCFGGGSNCSALASPAPSCTLPGSCVHTCGAGAATGCACTPICVCDTRTAGQISGGCNPCRLSTIGGSLVTVTDSFGQNVSLIINSLF